MFIKLNKNTKYVNFNKHYQFYKIEIYSAKYISVKIYLTKYISSYTHYTNGGYLKLNRNEFIYNITVWKYIGLKILQMK